MSQPRGAWPFQFVEPALASEQAGEVVGGPLVTLVGSDPKGQEVVAFGERVGEGDGCPGLSSVGSGGELVEVVPAGEVVHEGVGGPGEALVGCLAKGVSGMCV